MLDDRGQRRFSFALFLLGVDHLQAQAIIRSLFPELRPDSGEELDGLKGNSQNVVRTQIESTAALGSIRVDGNVNGRSFTAQVERGAGKNPLSLRVAHNGTQIEAMVLSPLGARLLKLMPYKAPPDLSKFLMSPMPGLLVEVAVEAGQRVQAGEKLAVIEAMKMENVLFAARDGVIGNIVAAKGESLAVDEVILEFSA